jgi:Activator of Hsp90 ATPase homolog 1-like protein
VTDLIERELDLPASPTDVWRALTDPAWLAGWLADEVELELRPGGEARFRLGEEHRTGWVEEITPPASHHPDEPSAGRLIFWWTRAQEPASRVELVLIGLSDAVTRLRVAETRPLEILDLVGVPLPGHGGGSFGPALMAA